MGRTAINFSLSTALVILCVLICFHLAQNIFCVLCDFCLWPVGYWEVSCLLSKHLWISQFILFSNSIVIEQQSLYFLYHFGSLKLESYFMAYHMVCPEEYSMHAWEDCEFWCYRWSVLYMGQYYYWLFTCSVHYWRWLLKSLIIIV